MGVQGGPAAARGAARRSWSRSSWARCSAALVVVPVYVVIVKAYGIGTESLPAPSAISWKATAEAVRGGSRALPPYATLAGGDRAGGRRGAGAARPRAPGRASARHRRRWGSRCSCRPSLSLAALAGALLAAGWCSGCGPSSTRTSLTSLAAGGIAGESVMGVIDRRHRAGC